jgi:putative peptide zinc metalloprotease protein
MEQCTDMLTIPRFKYGTAVNGKCTVSFDNGSYFEVGVGIMPILRCLADATSIEGAYQQYMRDGGDPAIDLDAFTAAARQLLGRFEKTNGQGSAAENTYVKLKINLFDGDSIRFIINPMSVLFSIKVFVPLLLGALVFNLWQLFAHADGPILPKNITSNPLLVLSVVLTSTLLHELGHLAACRHHKAAHGGIGFGFYFIFPVFFSDVTGLWLLDRKQRILANLSGVYMELLLVSALFVMMHWVGDILMPAIMLIMVRMVYTLMPFLRNDGYWVLSDFLAIPNLLRDSHLLLRTNILSLLKTGKFTAGKQQRQHRKLLVYGLLNACYLPIFLWYGAHSYTTELLAFPVTIVQWATQMVQWNFSFDSVSHEHIVALFFYIFLTKFLIRLSIGAKVILTKKVRAVGSAVD